MLKGIAPFVRRLTRQERQTAAADRGHPRKGSIHLARKRPFLTPRLSFSLPPVLSHSLFLDESNNVHVRSTHTYFCFCTPRSLVARSSRCTEAMTSLGRRDIARSCLRSSQIVGEIGVAACVSDRFRIDSVTIIGTFTANLRAYRRRGGRRIPLPTRGNGILLLSTHLKSTG